MERRLNELEKGEAAFIGKLQTRDEVLDEELDNHQKRLDRHREDLLASEKYINTLQDRVMALEDENLALKSQVESMADKLCHCSKRSPTMSGEGTREEPFELEYASDGEYHTPPAEEQENAPPRTLVPIEEVLPEVAATEAMQERGREFIEALDRSQVRRQRCVRSSGRIKSHFHPYCKSTGQSFRRRVRMPVDSEISRNIRHLERGLGGYESDSKSGSSGLSEIEDCHPLATIGC